MRKMARNTRALLTPNHREFLPKQEEYHEGMTNPEQRRYDTRQAIADRLGESLKDFTLLFENLRREERVTKFGAREQIDDPELWRGARDAIAFLLRQTGAGLKIRERGRADVDADKLLLEAFQRVAVDQPGNHTVTGLRLDEETLQVEHVDLERVIERFRGGEELTLGEKQALLDSGRARIKLNE